MQEGNWKAKNAGLKLIFLTMNEDPDLAVEAMRAGAAGYSAEEKPRPRNYSIAIQAAFRGSFMYAGRSLRGCRRLLFRILEAKARATVTPRQREVLQLLAEGKSMKEAAVS